MKALRVLCSLIIVASTCLLVGVLAFDKLSATDSALLLNLSLQIMHTSFLIGSVVFAVHQFQHRYLTLLVLTLAPVFMFLLALAGAVIGVRPPNLSLLIFDFYVILYYFYLLIEEIYRSRNGTTGGRPKDIQDK